MKVRYIEDTVFLWCTKDKIYDVISIEYGSYRIMDDEGEDYLHDSCEFEIVEKDNVQAKKVYYLGDCETLELWDKDEYDVIEIVDGMFKIKDDLGREYLYSPNLFEILE